MAIMAIFFKDGFAAEIQLDLVKVVVQVATSGCPIFALQRSHLFMLSVITQIFNLINLID